MRILFFFLSFIIISACKDQGNKENSQLKAKAQNSNNELIGVWKSDPDDKPTQNNIGEVTMTFTNEGQLLFDAAIEGKVERMNLVYKIKGDTIISDQPSHPQEQKSRYQMKNDDTLIMEFDGEKTIFLRVKNK